MPKFTKIPSRVFKSYDPTSCLSLEDSKAANNSLFIDTSFIWNRRETQKYCNYIQDAFMQEAVLRMNGIYKLQPPLIDPFQTQGRTIYNADQGSQDPRKGRSTLFTQERDIDAEPHTPPRRHPRKTRRRVRSQRSSRQYARHLEDTDPFDLSSPNVQDLPPSTIFIAVTEDNEIELIPEQVVFSTKTQPIEEASYSYSSDTAEDPINEVGIVLDEDVTLMDEVEGYDDDDVSVYSTPSLYWSDSTNSSPASSPERDPTDGWNEGIYGPARPIIEPLDYGILGDEKPFTYPCSEKLEVEESFGHLFDLYINTEDCGIF